MAWQRALGARSMSGRVMLSVLGCAAVTGKNLHQTVAARSVSEARQMQITIRFALFELVRELLEIRLAERRSSNFGSVSAGLGVL